VARIPLAEPRPILGTTVAVDDAERRALGPISSPSRARTASPSAWGRSARRHHAPHGARLHYVIERDFRPIALVARLLSRSRPAAVQLGRELVAAKANPGKLLNACQ
jgi:hypothetical protein